MYSISLSRALPSSASRLPGTATRAVGYRVSHAIPTKTHACRPLHVSSRTDASDQQETSSNSNSADTSPQRRFVPPPTPGGKIQPGGSQRGPRVGTLVLGLIAIGVGATVLGLVDFFGSLKTWPKEVRDDLRTAIKARNRGESRRAEAHFRRALATARSLEPQKLEPGRLLKISGIAIALGSLLESEGELPAAYQVYAEALDEVLGQGAFASPEQPSDPTFGSDAKGKGPAREISPQERLRAVSLAQKLGDLASSGHFEGSVPPPPTSTGNASKLRAMGLSQQSSAGEGSSSMTLDDVAEKHYVWSVEELLRLVMSENQRQQALEADQRGEQGGVVLADLELPAEWGLTQSELGASMEALGGFYARKGKAELAVPLYLQALSILMPPPEKRAKGKPPTASERCRAGILMNNLSQLLVNGVPGSKGGIQAAASGMTPSKEGGGAIGQALSWAKKGLEVVQSTQRMAGWDGSDNGPTKEIVETSAERMEQVRLECAGAETTLLYNLGVLYEMAKDVCKAREYYQRAYARADEVGFRDARNRSAQALAKLERVQA